MDRYETPEMVRIDIVLLQLDELIGHSPQNERLTQIRLLVDDLTRQWECHRTQVLRDRHRMAYQGETIGFTPRRQ